MRKFISSFGLVCTVAAAAFLAGCHENCDSCKDGDKATVKTEADATPAANCATSCKDKAAGCSKSCSGEKKACPSTGQSN
jgi:hypothetical protein